MKYFSSDWHLGHENVIRFSDRPFKNASEMDDAIISQMLAPLKPSDDFYFLGDMGTNENAIHRFFQGLPKKVKVYWILGNHDKQSTIERFRNRCHFIGHMYETKLFIGAGIPRQSITMAHYPMITWNKSHYGAWQLFGHHHAASHGHEEIPVRAGGKQLNVNCEFHNYLPVTENNLIEIMKKLPENWDLIKR